LKPKEKAIRVLNWVFKSLPKGEWYVLPTSPATLGHPRSLSKLLPGLAPDDLFVTMLVANIIRVKGSQIIFEEKGIPAFQVEEKGSKNCIFLRKQFECNGKHPRTYWVLYPGDGKEPNLENETYRNGSPRSRTLVLPPGKANDINDIRNNFHLTENQKVAIESCVDRSVGPQQQLAVNNRSVGPQQHSGLLHPTGNYYS
jgi:hypothetical protein